MESLAPREVLAPGERVAPGESAASLGLADALLVVAILQFLRARAPAVQKGPQLATRPARMQAFTSPQAHGAPSTLLPDLASFGIAPPRRT
jgi:hypothetical protein